MGVSVGVPQFVAKIKGAGVAIDKDRKEQLAHIGKNMQEIHVAVIESALHGPKFRRWPAPMITKVTPVGTTGLRFAPTRGSMGPERVAEQGRHPGMAGPMQGPTLTKKGKVSRARRKRWNGTTKGKDTWTKTTEMLVKALPPKLQSSALKAVSEVFR